MAGHPIRAPFRSLYILNGDILSNRCMTEERELSPSAGFFQILESPSMKEVDVSPICLM